VVRSLTKSLSTNNPKWGRTEQKGKRSKDRISEFRGKPVLELALLKTGVMKKHKLGPGIERNEWSGRVDLSGNEGGKTTKQPELRYKW